MTDDRHTKSYEELKRENRQLRDDYDRLEREFIALANRYSAGANPAAQSSRDH